jgi:hypothetical protein
MSMNLIKTFQHKNISAFFQLFSFACEKTVMAKLRGTFLQLFVANAPKRGINVHAS